MDYISLERYVYSASACFGCISNHAEVGRNCKLKVEVLCSLGSLFTFSHVYNVNLGFSALISESAKYQTC